MDILFEQEKKLNEQEYNCNKCQLFDKFKNDDYLKYKGKGEKKILLIQTSYSYNDYLEDYLAKLGINLYEDCWIIRTIRCATSSLGKKVGDNDSIIKNCSINLYKDIENLKPEKILLFGDIAFKSLYWYKFQTGRLSLTNYEKWTGFIIPDQDLECFVFPLYNPLYFLDKDENKKSRLKDLFEEQLKQAIKHNKRFYKHNYESDVGYSLDVNESIEILKKFRDSKVISFDYETTGLKPYKKGHEIVCIGLSDGILNFAFPIFDNKEFTDILQEILTNPNIKKIAHNLKFEHNWTRVILGYEIQGWLFDTMLSSHILDNREGITGLKFQTFVNLGILGYDSEIDNYLKSEDDSSNSFNKIKKCDLKKLLKYCAMDSYFTYRIYEIQKDKIFDDKNLSRAYRLFHDGSLTLADIEFNGFKIDETKLFENMTELTNLMNGIENQIKKSDEVILFKKKYNSEFNFRSNPDLTRMFFKILGLESKKVTTKGNPSVDKEVLSNNSNIPLIQKILEYKKLDKIKNTYLMGFFKEVENGYLHPFYNLNTASSYRSSSSNPNMQNCPKRDKEANQFIRSIVIPEKNMKLVEIDYGSLEVRIGSCYHKDSNMINYILDETTDMHRDTAMDIFFRTKDTVLKDERFLAKNGFVFAEFYGDYYGNCAKNIWEKMSDESKEHLKKNKITNYLKFENHLKEIENIFWNERFEDYGKWRNDNWNNFLKTGKVNYYTGFRGVGNLSRNQVNNISVQGSAFHCLLWSLTRLNYIIKKRKLKSKIIGQIHDSIVMMIDEDEWNTFLMEKVRKIMTEEIKEEFEWVVVPLKIAVSYYEDNWSNEIKEVKL